MEWRCIISILICACSFFLRTPFFFFFFFLALYIFCEPVPPVAISWVCTIYRFFFPFLFLLITFRTVT